MPSNGKIEKERKKEKKKELIYFAHIYRIFDICIENGCTSSGSF